MSITPECWFNIWEVNLIYIFSIFKPLKTKCSCNWWCNFCSCYVIFWFKCSIWITWEEIVMIDLNAIYFCFYFWLFISIPVLSNYWCSINYIIITVSYNLYLNPEDYFFSTFNLFKKPCTTLWYWLYS
jgi:hypothetical protein